MERFLWKQTMPAKKLKWRINFDQFYTPKQAEYRSWFEEFVVAAPGGQRAAAIYRMSEVNMGWYVGGLALFENRQSPRMIMNPKRLTVCGHKKAARWASPTLLYVTEYCGTSRGFLGLPFILLDLEREEFAYLPIENALAYRLELTGKSVQLIEENKDERFPPHNGKKFVLNELVWIKFSKLGVSSAQYIRAINAAKKTGNKKIEKKIDGRTRARRGPAFGR